MSSLGAMTGFLGYKSFNRKSLQGDTTMKAFTLTPELKSRLTSVARGEISIVLGEDAAENLRASLHLAGELRKGKGFKEVIYLNLPFSRSRFTQTQNSLGLGAQKSDAGLKVFHLLRGRAADSVVTLEDTITDPTRTAIIINSWELSSSSYRLRELLIFALHALQAELGVTIIVFAMSDPAKVKARRLNRTGLGKLALAADSIISINEEEPEEKSDIDIIERESEPEIQMLPEHIEEVQEEQKQEVIAEAEDVVGVNLSSSKNNNLPDAPKHLNRRERRKLERLATIGRV
ncbi:MAG TPA: hypothetical protein VIX80_09450 [Candidatus Kapabacteria bacterium]